MEISRNTASAPSRSAMTNGAREIYPWLFKWAVSESKQRQLLVSFTSEYIIRVLQVRQLQ